MICYLDRAFCSAACANHNCPRHFTDEIQLAAREWWSHDPDHAPIAFSDFSKDCEEYMKK